MKNTSSHSTNGTVALAFYEFDLSGKKPKMRFINDTKWMTCFAKWKPLYQYLRGRKFAAVLQGTVPGTGKSGISMDPLGVLAVFETEEDARMMSVENMNYLTRSPDPARKIALTQQFAERLKEILHYNNQGKNFYESTKCIIDAYVAATQPYTPPAPPTPTFGSTLRF